MSLAPLHASIAPRASRSLEEKRRIVELTMRQGASVQLIAQDHGISSSTLYQWISLYSKGRMGTRNGSRKARNSGSPFLPVNVDETPHLPPSQIVIRIDSPTGIGIHIEIGAAAFHHIQPILTQLLQ